MSYNRVTANILRKAMLDHELCQVLDVRDRQSFLNEHIAGSAHVPLAQMKERLSSISKVLPVYLVCRTGHLSDEASIFLRSHGFDNVYVVAGGLLAWSAQGFPLEQRRNDFQNTIARFLATRWLSVQRHFSAETGTSGSKK